MVIIESVGADVDQVVGTLAHWLHNIYNAHLLVQNVSSAKGRFFLRHRLIVRVPPGRGLMDDVRQHRLCMDEGRCHMARLGRYRRSGRKGRKKSWDRRCQR